MRSNHTAATALVFHHKGLLQLRAPSLSDGAAHHVAAATCRHGHDVFDGFVGVAGLRLKQARRCQDEWCGLQDEAAFHVDLSRVVLNLLVRGQALQGCAHMLGHECLALGQVAVFQGLHDLAVFLD